jgi:hypothetical protein
MLQIKQAIFKLIFGCTIIVAALAYHPVNQDLINYIKAEASWKAMEIHENPFT